LLVTEEQTHPKQGLLWLGPTEFPVGILYVSIVSPRIFL